MLGRFFRPAPGRVLVDALHGDIVAAARRPAFYVECGVRDTFEGRFEVLALHLSAVARRLEALPNPGRAMAQELVESMFAHLDIALREIGVTDLGVPKRMKKLAGAYFGRAAAYAEALRASDAMPLQKALARNIFSEDVAVDDARPARLARYMRAQEAMLAGAEPADLMAGRVAFPDALVASLGEA
jgi:cytochrome b pre-mRNA-processing protein 3